MYARLRGVHENLIGDEVATLIRKLTLDDYTKKLAGDLRYASHAINIVLCV